ncbi:hypothetical protein M422DRAFT_176350 [Sphaerobolus stellatus SS14]|uniref:Uncharacterized protein n=1 Tax=Sphaerobolus stellatus (strain SS14) TaxID=990650 RepID=A0A0C9UUN7_SPHS4|nr:hypothetical protein M422DRAFT_176350 [Sphaerobolus stellatus SS14]
MQFREGEITHEFQGQPHTFKFKYRDPWEWLVDIVTDPTLASSIIWYPVEKYLHHGNMIIRIYDEVNTGKRWWEIQDQLPRKHGLPHCFLPLHLWLDKGKVSKTTKKHPIVLRAAFLPSETRNASGNGGGVFIGCMPIVCNPNDTIESEDDTPSSVELAQFKREVYHKVLHVIFRSIRKRSHHGDTLKCGDKIRRVLYPGFLIHSVDGEEGCATCGTRGAQAKHSCPKCLAPKLELSHLAKDFVSRTQHGMIHDFKQAKHMNYSSRLNILRDVGLHYVKNALWKINNSSPYEAYSYDMLHAFDLGEWGKHLWPLITEKVLKHSKNKISRNMRQIPRWRGLKHFSAAAEIDFADGNTFRDILKCIIPCIVQLLPHNSSLVHCVRTSAVLRALAGLRIVRQDHLELYKEFLVKYEKWFSNEHDKSFNYPKHHNLIHLPEDVENKGCTESYSTRPGEGFHQQIQQAYDQTNFKNTDPQIIQIDENQEAIARIRMFIDIHDQHLSSLTSAEDLTDGAEPPPAPVVSMANYALGCQELVISEKAEFRNCIAAKVFCSSLRVYLDLTATCEIDEGDRPTGFLTLTPYQCLYLTYMSVEDWREKTDILRCNPSFHNSPRYDCVVINTNPVTFGRLEYVFSCKDAEGQKCDLALVRKFEDSCWRPKTKWEGCRVLREKEYGFVLLKYLIRGCHLIPTLDKDKSTYYVNDLVDNDAFIRFFLDK